MDGRVDEDGRDVMVRRMRPAWPCAGLLLLSLIFQTGCTLLDAAKTYTAPVTSAASMIGAGSKAAAKSVGSAMGMVGSTSAAMGSTAGGATVGTGRVVVSGISSASRVSASSVRATGSVGGATVRTSGNLTGNAVRGGGRVAGTAVRSGTRVSATGIRAAGSLSSSTINKLSRMSQAGLITFVDTTGGKVVRVPWRAGLNVYGGSALANLQTAERALAIIRGGRLVYQTVRALADARGFQLEPGDVLRLANHG